MPKQYKLKTAEELAADVRRQNAKDDGTSPIDWAHEAAIDDIKKFFCTPGPGDLRGEEGRATGDGKGPRGGEPQAQ